MEKVKKNRVLLIGWDAADWKIITPLLDSGQMPALESLVNRGVIGKLATLEPTFSPMLWTSIATGKTADKHGILGFIEPTPEADGIRPVNVTSRKVKAIWNILHNNNKWVNLINWWPSFPAEPVNGVIASNYFPKPNADNSANKLTKSIHPESWVKKLMKVKVNIDDITDKELLNFVPDAVKIDQDKDKSLNKLSAITAENLTVYYATIKVMQETDWDFTGVYFGGIDQYCHQFMKYHPPKLDNVENKEYILYNNVINEAYRFHDEMLGHLLKRTDENTTVILISDHGFHSDHLRPQRLPNFTAAAAIEHSPFGIICIAGPEILKDERIHGASLLDITPTILKLFDLPIGEDMDGSPLLGAFKNDKKFKTIPSWEDISGDFGTHFEIDQVDTFASAEAMQQLVELGYIDEPSSDINKSIAIATKEANFNLAQTFLSTRRHKEAMLLLEELYNNDPKDIRFNLDLLRCYIELKEFVKARTLINNIDSLKEDNRPNIELLKGMLLMYEKEYDKAISTLRAVEKSNPEFPNLQTNLGNAYLKAGLYTEAIGAYTNSLKVDDGNAGAYRGLSICYLRLNEYENAAENALTAIGLLYNMPLSHYHLGEALFYLKKYKESSMAFELALKMAPNLYKARLRLKKIYATYIKNSNQENRNNLILNEIMKGEIIIVSGLPRSGTSVLMQMLNAGGLNILCDNERKPDDSNPKGYYEYLPVKNIKNDTSFINEADGKVVKVVAPLLKYLPEGFYYRVIFIKRDLNEVMVSQQKMMGKTSKAFSLPVAQAFEREVKLVDIWANKEPNVDILHLNYKDVINNTENEVNSICSFLGKELNKNSMREVVIPDLYRNRLETAN